jgi:nucleoside-diphosphate-sugar epimerase
MSTAMIASKNLIEKLIALPTRRCAREAVLLSSTGDMDQMSRAASPEVLVTGATGFVGSHLVDCLLERGYRPRCLVRPTSNLRYLSLSEVELFYGELDGSTDWEAALDGIKVIYHVAGVTFAARRQDYFKVNHRGTEAVLAAAVRHRDHIKRFVLISSLAAVGPGRDGQPVTEEAAPAPITAYGRSKLLAEEAARAVSDLLPITIIRPPAVYGPRDYAIYELFKLISRGILPTIGRYDKKISLVHARDLAHGIILAAESQVAAGRTYFISDEEVYCWSHVSQLLARILGRPIRTITIPRPIALGAALFSEALAMIWNKPPILNRDKVADLSQRCWACSTERARRELGYRQRIPLEDGLRETLEWYRNEGWL